MSSSNLIFGVGVVVGAIVQSWSHHAIDLGGHLQDLLCEVMVLPELEKTYVEWMPQV